KIHNRKTPAQHTQPRNEEPGQAHQTKNKTEHPHTNQKSQHAGIPHGIKKLGTLLSSQKTDTHRSSADTSARLDSGKSDRLAPARRASSRCFAVASGPPGTDDNRQMPEAGSSGFCS